MITNVSHMGHIPTKYLAEIGRKGGRKSRRVLSSEQAKAMVRLREARRAFTKFYARCFWHLDPDFRIEESHIPMLISGLKKYGGHHGFYVADKLKKDNQCQ